MASPQVSVVIPAYNSERYIAEAIASLQAQTFSNFEVVVVVDAASTDNTAAIVRELSAGDPRINSHQQQHAGIVAARNYGANLARGEFLAWLDADDVAVPRRLERQVEFLEKHPSIAAVGGTMIATDRVLSNLLPVSYPTQPADIRRTLIDSNALAMSTTMLRTSAFRAVGGFRSAFRQGAEDYDLWLRLAETYDLANLPEPLVYYRIHASQVSGVRTDRLVIPTVAAQLSAAARRAGRPDPYGDLEKFTYEEFVRIEGSRDRVNQTVLRAAAGQAIFLALIRKANEGRELLRWAAGLARHSRVGWRVRARALVAYGVVDWQLGRPGTALTAVLAGSLLDPVYMTRMATKGARLRFSRSR